MTISTPDALGHIGYVLLFIGMTMIAANRPIGWALRLAGEAIWIGISAYLGLTSGVLWGLAFAYIDIRTYRRLRWGHGTR
jgi:hypothetical protein